MSEREWEPHTLPPEHVSEFYVPKRDVYPSCILPADLTDKVWRYMDLSKFSYLVKNKALYFRRADLLEDKFEGTYSRGQIDDLNEWLNRQTVPINVSESEALYRKETRQKTYLSCWSLGDSDYDLMWKSYVGAGVDGIAICSTVKKLMDVCDNAIPYWPLDISKVTYRDFAGGDHIDYARLDPFINKDKHYKLDREIRLVHHPNCKIPSPDHVDIPIEIVTLINSVVLKPKTDNSVMVDVKKMLNSNGLGHVPIEFSRDDRDLPECA